MHGKLRRMLTKERVWMEKDEQVPFTLWREMKKKFREVTSLKASNGSKILNPSHTCGFQNQRNPGVPCTVPGLRTKREASAPGLLRLPPAASTKATTAMFQRGREKEQDR